MSQWGQARKFVSDASSVTLIPCVEAIGGNPFTLIQPDMVVVRVVLLDSYGPLASHLEAEAERRFTGAPYSYWLKETTP